ncbi:sulfotransferase 1C4-like [Littorina saxatilis]|uniref:Sulfotransferase domain-containing protein n=1 Tax=Littorina saxatilis TaxID=31220 RepID=A0AAN9BZJ7_9CAEN
MPQFLELKDKFGNNLYFGNGGDVRFAATPLISDFRQQLKDVRQLELRTDDVIVVGYPKSGNHWHQQIIRMLQQNSTEYHPNTFTTEVLEYIPQSYRPPVTGPRVFFSHLCFRHLPLQVLEKKVKVVHLTRNPKDTFVSMYAQLSEMKNEMGYSGTWDQFFQVMLEWGFWHGNYFDHLLDWEREIEAHPNHAIFVSNFEDMKRDPLGQIEKLNKFLGLERSHQMCQDIADACNISVMREKEEEQVRALKQVYKADAVGIYRKGEIGDWKNWFSPEQNEQFDEVYRKRMAESKSTFVFE